MKFAVMLVMNHDSFYSKGNSMSLIIKIWEEYSTPEVDCPMVNQGN